MIEDRLENWARHYRERARYECCASLEGRMYHAPWRQWVTLSEISHSSTPDWKDAEQVETAWRSMLGTSKLILKFTYMKRMPDYVIARKSHIPVWKYQESLRKAKNIISYILDINDSVVYSRQNLNRASEKISPIEANFSRPKESTAA